MNTEDLATYIEQVEMVPDNTTCTVDIAILCDLLHAVARAERLEQEHRRADSDWQALRERAERAEATIRGMAADALSREAQYDEMYERAERAEAKQQASSSLAAQLTEAQAALDRVRALRPSGDDVREVEPLLIGYDRGYRAALDNVRAAIEGGQ